MEHANMAPRSVLLLLLCSLSTHTQCALLDSTIRVPYEAQLGVHTTRTPPTIAFGEAVDHSNRPRQGAKKNGYGQETADPRPSYRHGADAAVGEVT